MKPLFPSKQYLLIIFFIFIAHKGLTRELMPNQNTSKITYFYSGNNIINEEDDAGNMSTYLGLRYVRTILNKSVKQVQSTFLVREMKDVIAVTDYNGKNISIYNYTPYGESISLYASKSYQNLSTSISRLSIIDNPYKYSNYYADSESGLYMLKARYYSPFLMRFISMDTYDLPNRYAYCNGNPIGNIDTDGHMTISLISLISDIWNSFNPIPNSFALDDILCATTNILQDLNMLDGIGEVRLISREARVFAEDENLFIRAGEKSIKFDSKVENSIKHHVKEHNDLSNLFSKKLFIHISSSENTSSILENGLLTSKGGFGGFSSKCPDQEQAIEFMLNSNDKVHLCKTTAKDPLSYLNIFPDNEGRDAFIVLWDSEYFQDEYDSEAVYTKENIKPEYLLKYDFASSSIGQAVYRDATDSFLMKLKKDSSFENYSVENFRRALGKKNLSF